jgi:TolB-like protein/Flp pilus assembly protein TadD/predicted Ser/Thr protein kinase
MGEVYRAEDTTLDREVALKVLPTELASDPERLARFEREAKTLAALDHPNIVTIYTVEEADGVRFLTMQLVDGKQLSELIPRGGMPVERIFELAIPLAEALAAAHEKGVVHRDLKPANIMVTNDDRVKVLDFGLAKLQQDTSVVVTTEARTEALTGEGRILGTMPYMSPEQLEGKEIDARSDIFSFGAMLYEMATGERPFQGDTSVSLISSIVKDTPQSVDALKGELPHHLARIVNRCLEKNPKRRYQSAIDVYNELDALRKEVDSGIVQPSSAEVSAAEVSAVVGPRRRRWWPVAAVAVVVLVAALALWFSRRQAPSVETAAVAPEAAAGLGEQPPMIVVLPFQNLGSSEDEYFADGMTEEITSRLAVVSGLRVISRTSAMQYKESRPPLKQIGEELGVDYVLEGTVRWARADGDSRVRITPQLVRVADDSHMWASSYDRVIEDVFAIQSEIASKVVQELGLTLLEPERQELETQPTENLEAYQAYLRGQFHANLPDFSEENRAAEVESYQRAVDLDPGFALAQAALCHAHAFFYRLGFDLTEARRAMAKEAFDRAMALDPESPQVLFEVGFYHYYVEQDYEAALGKFLAAAEANPNDGQTLAAAAFIWRRQGKFEEGIERLERALELSPRDSQIAALIGEYSQQSRNYPQALEYLDIAIGLAPDEAWPYRIKAHALREWQGDLTQSQRVLESLPTGGEATPDHYWGWSDQYRLSRDFEKLLELQEAPSYEWITGQLRSAPVELGRAETLSFLGRAEPALAAYDAARITLEEELEERPDDYRLHSSLGLAYAGLGRKAEAIAEGKKAVEMQPVEKDAYIGPPQVVNLARIYTQLGELDLAVDQLDYLLSIPSKLSRPLLRLDPRWDPLRDHPRFQALLESD